jgi:hypothetical protein
MLDDLFELLGNRKRRYGHGDDYGNKHDHYPHGDVHDGNSPGYQHKYNYKVFNPGLMLVRVLQNKQLLIVLSIAAIILLIGFVAAIIMAMPILYQMFALLEKNGIKGIIDSALPIINKLWEGSGK